MRHGEGGIQVQSLLGLTVRQVVQGDSVVGVKLEDLLIHRLGLVNRPDRL